VKRMLPAPMRSQIDATGEGLLLTIPGPVVWPFRLVFAAIPLPLLVVAMFMNPPLPMRLLFLLVGGAFALGGVQAWFGRERIRVTADELIHWREPIGGTKRSYDLAHVRRLRTSPAIWTQGSGQPPPGAIAFDYGARTVRIGSGIDEAEALMLLQAIASRFPHLDLVDR
jgi:hypothetical protein